MWGFGPQGLVVVFLYSNPKKGVLVFVGTFVCIYIYIIRNKYWCAKIGWCLHDPPPPNGVILANS